MALVSTPYSLITIFFSLNLFLSFLTIGHEIGSQNFIVQVQNSNKPLEFSDIETWYMSILNSLTDHNNEIIHVYKTVFHGFSTSLTPQQLQQLKKRPEIIGVMPDQKLQLLTTRSPLFLGLITSSKTPNNLLKKSNYGSNVTIALLDTGIWPERESFNDKDFEPIPSHNWNGVCEGGEDFPKTLCNKKLIGVRYFNKGVPKDEHEKPTARDTIGHGTHTASTATGRAVNNASLLGYAKGKAVGMAEKARLAIYRVCWGGGYCMAVDILAGMDKAVEDGVDIISMSLSGDTPPYHEDPIAIGSFGAMEKGVLVSLAAGNGGFEENTVSNVAPWMTTVGASTIDRAFPADLVLEDGTVLTGTSLFKGKALSNTTYIPLFYGFKEKNYCEPGSLKKSQVSGKIVVCDGSGVFQGVVVKEAGGVGVVSLNTPEEGEGLMAEPYMIPGLQITLSSREKLLNYINSTKNAGATMVFHGTKLGYKPAPVVAFFSSRGPNPLSNYVLKPDVIAPGVNILAAWPANIPPSRLSVDPRRTEFNILSGTSMACPHVSGIAALLKGAHPDWSPAMIKSALMTTAYTHDHDGNPILDEKDLKETNVWGMGAGHVDPEKALDPGLVYDLTVEDYLGFLCASNYSTKNIKTITGRSVTCSLSKIENPWDLNYPAISVAFADASKSEVLVTRTVTHVSDVSSATYKVSITSPKDVTVTVDPETLVFKEKGEKLSYKVKIQADKKMLLENKRKKNDFDLGRLVWTDGKHQVTSLIVLVQ
ncbi:hypothetical protein LWI29_031906 [Acer saccharum]|uniref:Uncharacterized protein n=1 Tax=Acer saccharum TaxID=4024 RepID=A0AA39SJZ1_ACESA|nr:hypothetical protein LWI29_031906 [Acer saccharum]